MIPDSPLYAWLHFFTDSKTQSRKPQGHMCTGWKPEPSVDSSSDSEFLTCEILKWYYPKDWWILKNTDFWFKNGLVNLVKQV